MGRGRRGVGSSTAYRLVSWDIVNAAYFRSGDYFCDAGWW